MAEPAAHTVATTATAAALAAVGRGETEAVAALLTFAATSIGCAGPQALVELHAVAAGRVNTLRDATAAATCRRIRIHSDRVREDGRGEQHSAAV